MSYFARLSPLRAIRDLRVFLAGREKHELWFFLLAIVITTVIIAGFVKDSHFERAYKRDIIYVQQWRLDRTDAEIRAQQKIDAPIKAKALAELEARRAKRQAEFKRLDDKLTRYGF